MSCFTHATFGQGARDRRASSRHRKEIECNGNDDGDEEQEEDDDDGDDGQENQVRGRRKGVRARKFRNEDLPGLPGSMAAWREVFLPRWFQYLSTINDVWKLDHPDHVTIAQAIWDRKVKFKHVISARDEPVFFLVSHLLILAITDLVRFQLKQRTYEWRGEMGDRAEKAVQAFFDRYVELDSPAARRDYVAWAVPTPEEKVDARGRKVLVPPPIYPYMWRDVRDGPNGLVSCASLYFTLLMSS